MCITPRMPAAPVVPTAPSATTVAADAAKSSINLVTQSKKKVASQQGTFGSIFTSLAGDSTYGQSTNKVATFGSVGA